jgi:hypothetical protein
MEAVTSPTSLLARDLPAKFRPRQKDRGSSYYFGVDSNDGSRITPFQIPRLSNESALLRFPENVSYRSTSAAELKKGHFRPF